MRTIYRFIFVLLVVCVALFTVFAVWKKIRSNVVYDEYRPSLRGAPLEFQINPQMSSGHLLTLSYTGQQVAGIRGLLSQQCWVEAFGLPMRIVAPFLENSHLRHSKEMWTKSANSNGAPTFDRYFDLAHFNKMSEKAGSPTLSSWDEFLQTGSKDLIVVNIHDIFHKNCLSYTNKIMCMNDRLNTKSVQQFTTGCKRHEYTSSALEYLKSAGFRIVRTVCLNCEFGMEASLSPTEIVEHILGEYRPNEVTVVITQWKFSINMSPKCSYTCTKNALEIFVRPSQSLIANVEEYENRFSRRIIPNSPQKMTVGIMIRIEWFLISSKRNSVEKVRDCLKAISEKFATLQASNKQTTKLPILAIDVGKFGSKTIESTMAKNDIRQEDFTKVVSMIKEFVSRTYEGKLTFEEWEETYDNVVDSSGELDGGYIAAVQSTLASRTDCLILMGGGHFQEIAMDHYLNRHYGNTKCLHQICVPKSFTRH